MIFEHPYFLKGPALMHNISFIIFLIISLPAFAQSDSSNTAEEASTSVTESKPESGSEASGVSPLSVYLGINYSHFDYKEDVEHPLKSTESGNVPAGQLFVLFQPNPKLWFSSVMFEYAKPTLLYDGSTQSGRPLSGKGEHKFFTLEGHFGLPVVHFADGRGSLKVYSGVGYRSWHRGLDTVTPGVSGYTEDYRFLYMPFGAALDYSLIDGKLDLAVEASTKWQLLGDIKINFSELDPGYDDNHAALGYRPGAKLQLPVTFHAFPHIAFRIAPWIEYSAIGRSDTFSIQYRGQTVGHGYEPNSRTIEYGSVISVGAEL